MRRRRRFMSVQLWQLPSSRLSTTMRVKPRVGGRRGAEPEVRTLLIGYGAIARAIRNGIADDRRVSVTHVLVRPERKDALQRELGAQVRVVANIEELK